MKNLILFQAMIVLLSMASCNHKGTTTDGSAEDSVCATTTGSGEEAFEAFAKHFSKTASFAYADVSGRKVLLVSQETFGNNENADKEGIEASIFALDSVNKIISLGSIRSQGTLYPVTLLDGKLMVAGHQFVKVYSIRGDVPELVLDTIAEGYGPEMAPMFETFSKGTSVKFHKQ